MSYVTNTILAFSIIEDVRSRFEEVNTFFTDRSGFMWTWHSDEEWTGGSKHLEHPTFVAAFNHLDFDGLIVHLRSVKWEEPENVQLIICGQDDDRYEIHTL
jgi:hypothetical protein